MPEHVEASGDWTFGVLEASCGELLEIGRDHHASIPLREPSVSRQHCLILPLGSAHLLWDCGSRNGTFVNGKRTSRRLLEPGDQVRVGSTVLTYLLRGPHGGSDLKEHWLAGQTVCGYKILGLLREGLASVIFRALHRESNHAVALKLLMPTIGKSREAVEELRWRVELLAGEDHPRVVRVFETGLHGQNPFVTKEILELGSIEPWLAAGRPIPLSIALTVVRDAAEALAWAETLGLAHGHLRPGDLLVDRNGRLKLDDLCVPGVLAAPGYPEWQPAPESPASPGSLESQASSESSESSESPAFPQYPGSRSSAGLLDSEELLESLELLQLSGPLKCKPSTEQPESAGSPYSVDSTLSMESPEPPDAPEVPEVPEAPESAKSPESSEYPGQPGSPESPGSPDPSRLSEPLFSAASKKPPECRGSREPEASTPLASPSQSLDPSQATGPSQAMDLSQPTLPSPAPAPSPWARQPAASLPRAADGSSRDRPSHPGCGASGDLKSALESDVRSLGRILYALLSGRDPLVARGDPSVTACGAVRAGRLGFDPSPGASAVLVPVSRIVPGLPREIDRLLERMLTPSPGREFRSAAELLEAVSHAEKLLGVAEGPRKGGLASKEGQRSVESAPQLREELDPDLTDRDRQAHAGPPATGTPWPSDPGTRLGPLLAGARRQRAGRGRYPEDRLTKAVRRFGMVVAGAACLVLLSYVPWRPLVRSLLGSAEAAWEEGALWIDSLARAEGFRRALDETAAFLEEHPRLSTSLAAKVEAKRKEVLGLAASAARREVEEKRKRGDYEKAIEYLRQVRETLPEVATQVEPWIAEVELELYEKRCLPEVRKLVKAGKVTVAVKKLEDLKARYPRLARRVDAAIQEALQHGLEARRSGASIRGRRS